MRRTVVHFKASGGALRRGFDCFVNELAARREAVRGKKPRHTTMLDRVTCPDCWRSMVEMATRRGFAALPARVDASTVTDSQKVSLSNPMDPDGQPRG